MGQAAGVLLGAVLFYSAIVSPLMSRSSAVAVRQPEPVKVVTPLPVVEAPTRIHQGMRQRIITRVPEQYPIFLGAAMHALQAEESCKGVTDTDADTLAWGLLGHSLKENGLCKGVPEERCKVSSTGNVGPLQFDVIREKRLVWDKKRRKHVIKIIPSTWDEWGRDGDGDGAKNPEALTDSAYAAAAYLCDLRQKTGSWSHAMCRYYGDNVDDCDYENRVRAGIEQVKTVLAEEEERKRLEAEGIKTPQKQKPSRTLSKAKSTHKVR